MDISELEKAMELKEKVLFFLFPFSFFLFPFSFFFGSSHSLDLVRETRSSRQEGSVKLWSIIPKVWD